MSLKLGIDTGGTYTDAVLLDDEQRLVNIAFTMRSGPRVYIGRIDIPGNNLDIAAPEHLIIHK